MDNTNADRKVVCQFGKVEIYGGTVRKDIRLPTGLFDAPCGSINDTEQSVWVAKSTGPNQCEKKSNYSPGLISEDCILFDSVTFKCLNCREGFAMNTVNVNGVSSSQCTSYIGVSQHCEILDFSNGFPSCNKCEKGFFLTEGF
jgi:hypothetical protein